MQLKIYQVDAFAESVFTGNPAAVCPLDNWIGDEILQKIAEENNLAETAFYVKEGSSFTLRWFTPSVEVDLCGHATLAAAYVLFEREGYDKEIIDFISPRSGKLTVARNNDLLTLDFPADKFSRIELTDEIMQCFNFKPKEAYKGKTDLMLVFNEEKEIRELQPEFDKISKLGGRGVIVTSKGDSSDFVSRFFAPQVGIKEDPVTGSAHTTLTPYWASITGRKELSAIQLSERRGYLKCKSEGERVYISGKAQLYLEGMVYL